MAQASRLQTLLKQRAALIELCAEHSVAEADADEAIQGVLEEMRDLEEVRQCLPNRRP